MTHEADLSQPKAGLLPEQTHQSVGVRARVAGSLWPSATNRSPACTGESRRSSKALRT